MSHLSLVRSQKEAHKTGEIVDHNEKEAVLIAGAFDECFDAVNEQNIKLSIVEIPAIKGAEGIQEALRGMGDNEARSVRLDHREIEGDSETNILAIKRSNETESLFTFFSVHTGEGVQSARVFQESIDLELGMCVQTTVSYDPDTSFILDSKKSMIADGEFISSSDGGLGRITRSERAALKDEKMNKARNDLHNITRRAVMQSVEEATSESMTEEIERIKANVRGKGRIRALGAALFHLPESYREERKVA